MKFVIVLLVAVCAVTLAERDPICSLPPVTGMCKAYFRMYFYNPATGQCETFVYGGCGGNDNRFDSEEECKQKCVGCVHNGVEHEPGETYKVDCNTCTCLGNGLAACTLMACPPSAVLYN